MNTAIKYLSTVLFAFVAVLLMAAPSFATDLYWVGGDGTYDGVTNHFATTSGGTPTVAVPTSADNVIWDTLSNATGYTCTIGAAFTCKDFTMGAPLTGAVTFAGSAGTIDCYGSFSLASSTVRTWSDALTFRATSGTKTITTNGVTMRVIVFNGSGGTFQLADDLTFGTAVASNAPLTLTAGTFDPNGHSVTINHTGGCTISGAFTFYNLTRAPASGASNTLILTANITVTNLLTVSGPSVVLRTSIQSNAGGTARTITAASVATSYCDFTDITGAGAASWNLSADTGGSGDCDGNSGITFTTPADQHWMSVVGGNWSTAANWSGRVPLPQDGAYFDDATRGASMGTARTVTLDMPRCARAIDWTGATWTTSCTWAITTTTNIYGSVTMVTGLTMSGTNGLVFTGRRACTFDPKGLTFDRNITAPGVGGSLTMLGDLTMGSTRTFSVSSGAFGTGGTVSFVNGGSNYALNVGALSSTNGPTLTLGSATHTFSAAGTPWSAAGSLTITAFTGTLKFTDATSSSVVFAGGGKTYGNLWFARGAATGSQSLSGSNTFLDIKDDGTTAHGLSFASGSTTTFSTFTVSGTPGQPISINTTSGTSTHALAKSGGGTVTCDYLNIQHSVASGGTFNAGIHSTNNQATASAGSGWTFVSGRWWVGGNGNWDAATTTNWASSSGGAGGASVPTATDDVYFDCNSNATAYTVTVTATATCKDFNLNAPLSGALTWAGSSATNAYGNVVLGSTTVRSYTGTLTMKQASGTATLTTNGVAPLALVFGTTSVPATYRLLDALTLAANSSSVLTLATGCTFDANGFGVTVPGAGSMSVSGAFTFYDFTRTGSANFPAMFINATITVTHNLALNGSSQAIRLLVGSGTSGTQCTINAANVSSSYCDYRDIAGAGAGSWDLSAITGLSGDCGGNSSITFTTPTTQHWTNVNGGSWSTAANWTSRVPLVQDTCVMDCAFGASKTVTIDVYRIPSVDWTGATLNTTTFALTPNFTSYGSMTLIAGLTLSGSGIYGFSGRGTWYLDTKGIALNRALTEVTAPTSSLVLSSDIDLGAANTLTVTYGSLDCATYSANAGGMFLAGPGTVNLGTATHTLNGAINFTNSVTTFNAGTSTIKFTDTSGTALTLTGGGKTYNIVWLARGASVGSFTFSSNCTFSEIKDTGTAAHSLLFTAGQTQTVTTFTVTGTLGNLITLNSTTTATYGLAKTGSGKISCDYLNIQHAVATPGHTWFAGANSTDNQATATAGSGWIFTTVPTPQVNTINGILRTNLSKQQNLDEYKIDLRNAL